MISVKVSYRIEINGKAIERSAQCEVPDIAPTSYGGSHDSNIAAHTVQLASQLFSSIPQYESLNFNEESVK